MREKIDRPEKNSASRVLHLRYISIFLLKQLLPPFSSQLENLPHKIYMYIVCCMTKSKSSQNILKYLEFVIYNV